MCIFGMAILFVGAFTGHAGSFGFNMGFFAILLIFLLPGYALYSLWWLILKYRKINSFKMVLAYIYIGLFWDFYLGKLLTAKEKVMRLLLILCVAMLAACANTVPQYSQQELASGQLAHVRGRVTKAFSNEFSSFIHSVYDQKKQRIAKMGYMNYIEDVYLPAGNYWIVLLCERGNSFAHPSIGVRVEAGEVYEVFCDVAEKSKGLFGLERIDSLSANFRKLSDQ